MQSPASADKRPQSRRTLIFRPDFIVGRVRLGGNDSLHTSPLLGSPHDLPPPTRGPWVTAMKAITFQEIESLGYETVPDPEIHAPGDVIMRVRLAAICGSDLHVYHGREIGIDAGTVMGHEMLGEVVEEMLAHPDRGATQVPPPERPRLEVRGVGSRARLRDVTFDLYPGEVLGMVALEGQGQDELFDILAGSNRPSAGELVVDGQQVSFRHPEGYAVTQALIGQGVIGDFRTPDLMRFGFAPLYVRPEDVLRAAEILGTVMDERLWDRPEFRERNKVT